MRAALADKARQAAGAQAEQQATELRRWLLPIRSKAMACLFRQHTQIDSSRSLSSSRLLCMS